MDYTSLTVSGFIFESFGPVSVCSVFKIKVTVTPMYKVRSVAVARLRKDTIDKKD